MSAIMCSAKIAPVAKVASKSQAQPKFAQQCAKMAFAGVASFSLAASANAATIKLGSDSGELVFVPASITVAKGEKIEFVNNRGFPHNVVFDEDEIPSGVNADAISHEDYLNGPGESVSNTFDTAGSYSYYCEPHQGAGMKGKIIVQ